VSIPIGIGVIVGFLVIAELGRMIVAKLFGYPPERHFIPIMKLPGIRGTTGFRLTLILAGPVTIYLTVAALAFGYFRCTGTPSQEASREVERVMERFDAVGKLQAGDLIVEVDGSPFYGGASVLSEHVESKKGAPIALTVERAGAKQSFTVNPTKSDGRLLLGIVFASKREHSTVDSLKDGFFYPAHQSARTLASFIDIFTGKDTPDAGGPVRIVQEFSSAFESSTGASVLAYAMIFGTWALMLLGLFDLVRALLLILFRS